MENMMRWESLILETVQLGGTLVFIKDQAPVNMSAWLKPFSEHFLGDISFVSRSAQDLKSGVFQTRPQDLIFIFPSQQQLLVSLDSALQGQRVLLGPPQGTDLPVDFYWDDVDLEGWDKSLQNLKAQWSQLSVLPDLELSGEAPCLFLDRDDVVVKNVPYNKDASQVVLMPGIDHLINKAHQEEYWVALVTNQSGLGRGWVNWKEYRQVHQKMLELLAQKGSWIDESVWAGYYEEQSIPSGRLYAGLRKPRAGMFQLVNSKLKVNMSKSVMVGDSATDLIAAFSAGVGHLYLLTSEKLAKELAQLEKFQAEHSEFTFTCVQSFADVKLK